MQSGEGGGGGALMESIQQCKRQNSDPKMLMVWSLLLSVTVVVL